MKDHNLRNLLAVRIELRKAQPKPNTPIKETYNWEFRQAMLTSGVAQRLSNKKH
jgi:hypothetical protein